MSEGLTQCSACRTLIPPEKAAAMTSPLLCDACRERQAKAHSPEFPFATFVRFRSAVNVMASMLMIVAILLFVGLFWNPVARVLLMGMSRSSGSIFGHNFWTVWISTLPSTVLWNLLLPILLLMLRRVLLAFSDMMSDLFVAAYKEKL